MIPGARRVEEWRALAERGAAAVLVRAYRRPSRAAERQVTVTARRKEGSGWEGRTQAVFLGVNFYMKPRYHPISSSLTPQQASFLHHAMALW
jgi:hypothetical protein